MRDIEKMICSCGGFVHEVPTTADEREKYGCSRDAENWVCCVTAFECNNCKTRFTVQFESPELNW